MPRKKSIVKIYMLSAMLLIVLSSIIIGVVSISNDYLNFLNESKVVAKR